MSFLGEFFHHPPSHPEYQGPPRPPHPWIAEYDNQSQRWYFVNTQNGERSWQFPQSGGYGGGPPPQNYGAPQPQKESHTGRNTALAAAAGLAGGALLMHEGEKVEEHWKRDEERFDYDKDRFEDRVDYDRERFDDRVAYDEGRVAQGFEDAPYDAANWAGRKVQEVEDVPQDIENDYDRAKWGVENKFDNAVDDVEDAPDRIAGWAGREEGRVERFDDGIQDSFDAGRDEERYDDDRY